MGPGGGGGGDGDGGKLQGNFSIPPMWAKPHHQLQELEEELEEDGEGDGEEGTSTIRVNEGSPDDFIGPTSQFKPPPPALRERQDIGPPRKNSKESGGGGFGKALKDIMSSKRKNDHMVAANQQPITAKGGKPKGKEEDPEIRGFDNFFMY